MWRGTKEEREIGSRVRTQDQFVAVGSEHSSTSDGKVGKWRTDEVK